MLMWQFVPWLHFIRKQNTERSNHWSHAERVAWQCNRQRKGTNNVVMIKSGVVTVENVTMPKAASTQKALSKIWQKLWHFKVHTKCTFYLTTALSKMSLYHHCSLQVLGVNGVQKSTCGNAVCRLGFFSSWISEKAVVASRETSSPALLTQLWVWNIYLITCRCPLILDNFLVMLGESLSER